MVVNCQNVQAKCRQLHAPGEGRRGGKGRDRDKDKDRGSQPDRHVTRAQATAYRCKVLGKRIGARHFCYFYAAATDHPPDARELEVVPDDKSNRLPAARAG